MPVVLSQSKVQEIPEIPDVDRLWREFEALYPNDEISLDEITRFIIEEGGARCRNCGHQEWDTPDGRLAQCLKCNQSSSLTAGGFFDHMRAPQAWLAAIWFAEHGAMISNSAFQRYLKIAHSSARAIVKRVMAALLEPMEKDQSTVKIPSAVFSNLFRRRSFETKARQSPKTEEDEYAAAVPPAAVESVADVRSVTVGRKSLVKLTNREKKLLHVLSSNPVTVSELCRETGLSISALSVGLTMLEMEGLCKRHPGNRFTAAATVDQHGVPEFQLSCLDSTSRAAVKAASSSIIWVYDGISRKYLQFYLVAHWCGEARLRPGWQSVLSVCLRSGKKTAKQIFNSVTGATVCVSRLRSQCVAVG